MTTHTKEDESGYNVTVTGRHVAVTDGMKNHAIDKISKLERVSHRQIIDVLVTMDIQKLDHVAVILMKVGHLKVKVQAISNDMYVSIDRAVQKLRTKLQKYMERLQEHHAKPLSAVDMNVNVISVGDELDELNDAIEEETQRQHEEMWKPNDIVKQETRPLKTLTTDEAVMRMELSGDGFLVYRSEEDQKLKVIYRREDGNFGIIEPE